MLADILRRVIGADVPLDIEMLYDEGDGEGDWLNGHIEGGGSSFTKKADHIEAVAAGGGSRVTCTIATVDAVDLTDVIAVAYEFEAIMEGATPRFDMGSTLDQAQSAAGTGGLSLVHMNTPSLARQWMVGAVYDSPESVHTGARYPMFMAGDSSFSSSTMTLRLYRVALIRPKAA